MAVAVREQEIAGERFIELGGKLLVASKSTPNTWYELTGQTCTCKGFEFRGKCRHLVAAAQREEETPRATVEWSEQFGGWLVNWGGFVHGGVHFNRADADAHAAELAADPDFESWLTMHQYEEVKAR